MTNTPHDSAGRAYTSDTPLGTRTTVVPAILSCQDWRWSSNATQMKPSPSTMSERNEASARTMAVPQSSGRSSRRTTFRPHTMPPTVEPLSFHITAPYSASEGSRSALMRTCEPRGKMPVRKLQIMATIIRSSSSAAMRIQKPARGSVTAGTTGGATGGTTGGATTTGTAAPAAGETTPAAGSSGGATGGGGRLGGHKSE